MNRMPKKNASPRSASCPRFSNDEVVDLIHRGAERVEHRQHQQADQHRIEAEILIDDVGEIGAEDDERRMRDVDDIEHPERDRDADRHSDVETAEQHARDDGVDQKLEGEIHDVRRAD